jgi:acetylornithine deacetylase/succinyl-diaminopimelate desuccinylase-like protein
MEEMRDTAIDTSKTYGKKGHHPSLPGNPPAVDTGTLRRSVTYQVDENELVGYVGSNLKNPPYGAHVDWTNVNVHPGWAMKSANVKNEELLDQASQIVFGQKAVFTGQGGSISVIADFEKTFPNSTIVLTGILGPDSNAHAPNESLDIQYTKQLTEVISIYLKSVL